MRKTVLFNDDWQFVKVSDSADTAANDEGVAIGLPHTWNAVDGQDGGNDYHRGCCYYTKRFAMPAVAENEEVWLEFRGANAIANVYVNGNHLGRHAGGYSTFRVNITPALTAENVLVVAVDNGANREVYPQKADFTFYGGIYRDVYLLTVTGQHFSLEDGASGVTVSSEVSGDTARVTMRSECRQGDAVRFTVDGCGSWEVPVCEGVATVEFSIDNPRLWDGLNDPHLYTATAELLSDNTVVDSVTTRFGCRTIGFDHDNGFLLNGRSYPLRGVSRHQDRKGCGNAITRAMMEQDIAIIREMGANTIRLAHYQHDQYFYDLCDQMGMVVWAEIPYISEHMPEANQNTLDQLRELIVQNRNHASIVCWGLSNEITATGGCNDDIVANHIALNNLAHQLDPSRPTVTANVFMLETDSPLLEVPDILSYNLYFGWYLGALDDNNNWFERFRSSHPDKVIGLSEYGADANPRFQTAQPERGDYTEQYQAVYHEHMLEMFEKNRYLWATHLWNMFDFGADGRDEGGEHGLNQKGLVTFDRKLRKDAFYAYKAHWSDEPFVYICGRRYVDRAEETTTIKVYTNQPSATLYCDGAVVGEGAGRVVVFDLPISGAHTIEAKSGDCTDSITIQRVDTPNAGYMQSGGNLANWFAEGELQFPDGFYSIKDSMLDIKSTPQGAALIDRMMDTAKKKRGDVAQGVVLGEEMQRVMDAMTLENMLKMAGESISPEMVLQLNQALNAIPKKDGNHAAE